MFNTRDEIVELPSDFYDPYEIGNYIENIKTKEVAEIINIIKKEQEETVLLQTDIRNESEEGIIQISYKDLRKNWTKTERIIIKRLPSEEERLHFGLFLPEMKAILKLKLKK